MATFFQWFCNKDMKARTFWVTGSQVEYIGYVFDYWNNFFSDISEVSVVYGGQSDVWETLFQQTVTRERVVKIFNAELIPEDEWCKFAEFRNNFKLWNHTILLVKEFCGEKIDTRASKYRPFIDKGKGVFVNCQIVNEKDIVEFVKVTFEGMLNQKAEKAEADRIIQEKVAGRKAKPVDFKLEEYSDKLAEYFVDACGSQEAVIQSVKRFQVCRLVPLTGAIVDKYIIKSYVALLTEYLLRKDFERALLIVDTGKVSVNLFIGSISYRLMQISLLVYYRDKKLVTKKELLDMTGIPIFKLAELTEMSKGMTMIRLRKYVELLMIFDNIKNQIGALHWLIAMWR